MRTRMLAVVFGVVLGSAVASTALGSNDIGYEMGTNTILTIRQWYLQVQTAYAVTYNNSNNVDPTDLSTQTCTQNNNVSCSVKEVNIEDDDYGDTGWYGWSPCQSWETPTVCDWGITFINLHYAPYTDNKMRSLVCHEVGHHISLAHSTESNSCMVVLGFPVFLTTHDKGVVNSNY